MKLSKSIIEDKEKIAQRFEELIRREKALISSICFYYSGSVAEYDDLRQDALINIWRGLSSFRNESTSKTWLYRVVLNSCVSTIRKQVRHRKGSVDISTLYDMVADEGEERRDRIEVLHTMISTLPAQDKAFILMWLDEVSYEEMGEIMGIPRNTVATRIHRIREKLGSMGKMEF